MDELGYWREMRRLQRSLFSAGGIIQDAMLAAERNRATLRLVASAMGKPQAAPPLLDFRSVSLIAAQRSALALTHVNASPELRALTRSLSTAFLESRSIQDQVWRTLGASTAAWAAASTSETQRALAHLAAEHAKISTGSLQSDAESTDNELAQVGSVIQEVVDTVAGETESLEERIRRLLLQVTEKTPAHLRGPIKFVLVKVLFVWVLTYFGPADTFWEREARKTPPSDAIKRVERSVPTDMCVTMNLRFVSAYYLNVREEPTRHSRIVETLGFGTAVEVVQKRRRWSLVEWPTPEGLRCRGWVNTRYIHKFGT